MGATSRRRGWLTPNDAPTATRCRRILVPDDEAWIAIVSGALLPLIYAENWEHYGTLTPEQAAQRAHEMFLDYLFSDDCRPMIGAIVPYMTFAVPYGCLPCEGGTFARADYPALYDLLSSEFIIDADTFTVPDMRDRTVIGASVDRPFASTGGEAVHTLTTGEMPAHTHTTDPHSHGVYMIETGHPTNTVDIVFTMIDSPLPLDNTTSETVTVNPSGGGDAHNNMQPYTALRYCVVAK